MKKSHLLSLFMLLLCTFLSVRPADARPYRIGQQWHLGMKSGMVSFFGDLSVHDFHLSGKLRKETGFGYGLEAGKSINRIFDAKMSFIMGNMKGANPGMDMIFSNHFSAWSFGTSVQLNELIWPRSGSKISVSAEAALGTVRFRSIKSRISDDSFLSSVGYNPSGEISGPANFSLVIPLGIGAGYRISDRWSVSADLMIHLQHSDLLDSHTGNTGINDRYSFVSAGIFYHLFPADTSGDGIGCPEW